MRNSRETIVQRSCTETCYPLQKGQAFLFSYFAIICSFHRPDRLVYEDRSLRLLNSYSLFLHFFRYILFIGISFSFLPDTVLAAHSRCSPRFFSGSVTHEKLRQNHLGLSRWEKDLAVLISETHKRENDLDFDQYFATFLSNLKDPPTKWFDLKRGKNVLPLAKEVSHFNIDQLQGQFILAYFKNERQLLAGRVERVRQYEVNDENSSPIIAVKLIVQTTGAQGEPAYSTIQLEEVERLFIAKPDIGLLGQTRHVLTLKYKQTLMRLISHLKTLKREKQKYLLNLLVTNRNLVEERSERRQGIKEIKNVYLGPWVRPEIYWAFHWSEALQAIAQILLVKTKIIDPPQNKGDFTVFRPNIALYYHVWLPLSSLLISKGIKSIPLLDKKLSNSRHSLKDHASPYQLAGIPRFIIATALFIAAYNLAVDLNAQTLSQRQKQMILNEANFDRENELEIVEQFSFVRAEETLRHMRVHSFPIDSEEELIILNSPILTPFSSELLETLDSTGTNEIRKDGYTIATPKFEVNSEMISPLFLSTIKYLDQRALIHLLSKRNELSAQYLENNLSFYDPLTHNYPLISALRQLNNSSYIKKIRELNLPSSFFIRFYLSQQNGRKDIDVLQ